MDELVASVRESAPKYAEELADRTAKIARELVPVSDNDEPGHVHLRDTIRVEKVKGGANVVAGDAGRDVEHAGIVEERAPYLRPAARLAQKGVRPPSLLRR